MDPSEILQEMTNLLSTHYFWHWILINLRSYRVVHITVNLSNLVRTRDFISKYRNFESLRGIPKNIISVFFYQALGASKRRLKDFILWKFPLAFSI